MAKPAILYESRFEDAGAVPVASTTAAGFDVANLTDWQTFTFWKPTALPATVTADAGAGANLADYAVIWGHDLFTQGATIEVRGSTDNFGASDVLVATKTPTDDLPFVMLFTSIGFQYWRLRITGTTMPTLAIAALGVMLEMPSPLRTGFDPTKRKPMGRLSRSVAGNAIGRAIDFEDWTEAIRFELVPWSWVRATWIPAWSAHLKGTPFVFAWDRVAFPAELHLVSVADDFRTAHKAGQLADLDITLQGLAL